MRRFIFIIHLALFAVACSEDVGNPSSGGDPTGGGETPGVTLTVPVPKDGRAFVNLKQAAVVTPAAPKTSTDWDMAFEAYDAYTNSGVSGSGDGGAFGPLDAATYDEGTAPAVPFMTKDASGGAFRDFWAYDPSVHVLWVRYHVYGVRDKDKLWKVQILGYYGEQAGAPVSALYKLRWAEVTSAGVSATQELMDVDGTAGGSEAPEDVPSECLDLGTGARVMHTPAEALGAVDWHLCFRRAAISVNGELGGPRGVAAVDLHASETEGETLEVVQQRTDASELPRFDAVGYKELTDPKLLYRGDRVISALSDYWIKPGSSPSAPEAWTWLVQSAADGLGRYLVVIDKFEGAGPDRPLAVVLKIKPNK